MTLPEVFNSIGQDLVKELTRQLIALDKRVTGKLIKSLDYKLFVVESQRLVRELKIELTAAQYLEVVDGGRRKGAKMPPPKALDKWIVLRGLAPRYKGKFISRKSLQFLIARGISKNGIPATNVIQKSIDAVFKKRQNDLEEAAVENLRDLVDKILFERKWQQ